MTMYQIVEHDKNRHETYMMGFETETELSNHLHGKEAMAEYKKYSIVAWKIRNDGTGYIDLEKYWNRYNAKVA